MTPESVTVIITAECLCKARTFSTEVSSHSLPLQCNVCHCDSCRHSTGALHIIETTWPQPKEDVDISALQSYQFSANVTYRFCGTCSTLIFYESARFPSKLGVFTGALKNVDADIVRLTKNIFVEDTVDGGASVWFRKPNSDGKEIPRYREFSGEEIPWSWPEPSCPSGSAKAPRQDILPVWCHCKGINMALRFEDYASKAKEDFPWFIDPTTHKRRVNFDACNSCRLQFGHDLVHWASVELANLSHANGKSFPGTTAELKAAVDAGDYTVGTLAYYQSSPGKQRYFCKVCSTSAFFASNHEPEVVKLAIGLLEAPDGARAEGYLSWSFGDNLTGVDDTKGGWREELMRRVQTDAEGFRIARVPETSSRFQDISIA